MRKPVNIIALFLISAISLAVSAQNVNEEHPRKLENNSFNRGEYLTYRVYYDSWLTAWITAGFGTMKIQEEPVMINGRETYHIIIEGNSAGMFNWFFKVRDRFETFMDVETMAPHKFIRRTREGNYVKDDDVIFDHVNLYAQSRYKKKEIPRYVQDIVSAFYYLRNFDFDTAQANDEYFLDFFLDDSVYRTQVIFEGREKIKTEHGEMMCMRFKPQVAVGEIFQQPYPMILWVSDDKNKIPVLAKSGVFIGSVTIELHEYKNLRYPLGQK